MSKDERKQVRSKYIVRERGGDSILGIYYEPPELHITDPRQEKHDVLQIGKFVIGGPNRFDDMRDEIVSFFNRDNALVLVEWKKYTNKSMWFITGLEIVEWLDGIQGLIKAGFEIQKVTGFKRLLW